MPTKTKTEKRVFTFVETLNKSDNIQQVNRDFVSERTGTKLTNWKRAISSGGSATTGMSAFKHSGASSPGTVVVYYTTLPGSIWPDGRAEAKYSGFLLIPSIFASGSIGLTEADNQAIVRARKDYEQNVTQFMGMTFLGELRETIGMMRSPLKSLRQGLGSYLDSLSIYRTNGTRSKRQRRALKEAIAGTWLENAYGLQPLLNDVKGIAEQIARKQHDFKTRATCRGYGRSETMIFSDVTKFAIGSYGYGLQTRLRKNTTEVRYKAGILASVQAPFGSAERFLDEAGFRLDQFVPTVWELIPYSFVADYFSNAGDILMCACQSNAGISWINKTVRNETVETCSGQIDQAGMANAVGPGFRGAAGSFGRSFASSSEVVRSGPSTLGVPTLQFSIPGDTSLQWMNLAALFAQGASLSANFHR